MARPPIEVPVTSETKGFRQGIESGVIKPVEDAQKALDDLVDDRSPMALAGDMERAQKATKQLSREVERTADDIEAEFRRTYKKVRESSEDGMRGSSEAVGEFKNEFKQNLSETVSSFDGSMESMQDLAQGTFGGLASSLAGPLGVAAAGVAVGIGVVGSALEATNEKQERLAESAAEWATKFVESGQRVITSAQATATALDLISDPERYKEVEKFASGTGLDFAVALGAMAGESWALEAAQDAVNDQMAKADEITARVKEGKRGASVEEQAFMAAAKGAKEMLDEQIQSMADGRTAADQYSSYLVIMAQKTEGATKAVDEFGDTVYSLPDGRKIYVDAETGQATDDVDAIEKRIYNMPEKQKISIELVQPDASGERKKIEDFFRRNPVKVPLDVVGKYGRPV